MADSQAARRDPRQRDPRRRDPRGRRRAIIEAACALIAEVGVDGLTHRLVAARANLPLGATTYYFATLDELSHAALEDTARSTDDYLLSWAEAIRASSDLPATLTRLTEDYLADRPRALTETELYIAAIRRPELRPLSRRWFDGLTSLLGEHVPPATAKAAALLLDGAIVHALSNEEPLDAPTLTLALRSLFAGG